jgi:TRAP-type C4-dicarboxylate transport system permease small subunit
MDHGESDFGLEGLTRRISRGLAWIAGGAILFGCAVPITIDVVSRFFLNRTLLESFEISGYALAACIGLGMGYTVSTKANVRVDFLTMRLPPRIRVVFDLAAAVALAVVAAAFAYFAWGVLQQSGSMDARSMSILRVPLVPTGCLVDRSVLVCLRCDPDAGPRNSESAAPGSGRG